MSIAAILLPDTPVLIPEVGRGYERAFLKTLGGCRRAATFARAYAPDVIVVLAATPTASVWPQQDGRYHLTYDDLGAAALNRSVVADVVATGLLRRTAAFSESADRALADAARTALHFLRSDDLTCRALVVGVPGDDLAEARAAGTALRPAIMGRSARPLVVIAGALAAEPARGAPGVQTPALRFAAQLHTALLAGDLHALTGLDTPERQASGERVIGPITALAALQAAFAVEELSAEAPLGQALLVALLTEKRMSV